MAGDAGRDAGGAAGQGQGLWRLEVARQVLAEDYGPRLDWVAVAKALDHERFNIPDQVGENEASWCVRLLIGLWSLLLEGRARCAGLVPPNICCRSVAPHE